MAIKNSGFTLFEILISLLILSIITVVMIYGLQITIRANERITDNSQALEQEALGWNLISRDMAQLVQTLNNNPQDNITLKNQTLSFVTGGYFNPLNDENKSSLQRIEYLISNGQLIRSSQAWTLANDSSENGVIQQAVFDNIETIEWKFLGQDNQFYTTWPPTNNPQLSVLPRGIQWTIHTTQPGSRTRLFYIPMTGMRGSLS